MVMEALSRMIGKIVLGRQIKGFNAAVSGVDTMAVTHLLFADNTSVL